MRDDIADVLIVLVDPYFLQADNVVVCRSEVVGDGAYTRWAVFRDERKTPEASTGSKAFGSKG